MRPSLSASAVPRPDSTYPPARSSRKPDTASCSWRSGRGASRAARMFSHTQFGLSFLTLTFDDAVDDYFARQRVLERLQQAELPPDVQPQLAPMSTPVGELYRFRLVSDTRNAMELRGLED